MEKTCYTFLILRLKCQPEIEPIDGFFHLEIVVHAGEGGDIMPPREATFHRGHGAQVVDDAVFGVVGEPEKLGGKGVFEATIGELVADLQPVAPIQFGVHAMLARALVVKSGELFAPVGELEMILGF